MEPLDCGDHSCDFAKDKSGMRTNGGCRCLKPLADTQRHKVKAYIRSMELQIEEMKNTAPLNLLFAIQEACQPAGIASGLRLGVEILIREYKETLRLISELGEELRGLDGMLDAHGYPEPGKGTLRSVVASMRNKTLKRERPS